MILFPAVQLQTPVDSFRWIYRSFLMTQDRRRIKLDFQQHFMYNNMVI